jgi:hypothetical protein
VGVRRSASGGEFDLSNPLNSFVDVVRRVVLQPVRFFAGVPRSGALLSPFVFALVCVVISAILSAVLVFAGVQQNPGFNPNPQNALPSIFAPGSALLGIVFAPIGGAIGLFVIAAIQQLLVRLIVGESNSGFGATFRVASYTQVTSLVNWIPIIGAPGGAVRPLPLRCGHQGGARHDARQGGSGGAHTIRSGIGGGVDRCGGRRHRGPKPEVKGRSPVQSTLRHS